jgi:hypothetical protein
MQNNPASKNFPKANKGAFAKDRYRPGDSVVNISIPLPDSRSLFEESCIEDLDEEHLIHQLEQYVSKLQEEKEQANLATSEKLKEAKTRSLMTKYQMLFIKIEIYVTTFVHIIAERQKRLKLAGMLAIKHHAKTNAHKIKLVPELFLRKSVKAFSTLETLFVRKMRYNQIFVIMSFKFLIRVSQVKQDIEKSTHKVIANSKLSKNAEVSNSALFAKTQNSNFRKNSSGSMLNLDTQGDEPRAKKNREAVSRNQYLRMRLRHTEEIGMAFVEELDTMMSLFIKKNEKQITKKVK